MKSISLCVIFSILRVTESYQGHCYFDTRCHCTNRTDLGPIEIECAGMNISNIPNFPSSAVNISMAFNLAKVIRNMTFERLLHLEILDISFNRLSYFEPEAFIGLDNLKQLQLQGNYLFYETSSFPTNVFKPLTSLETLDVRYAKFTAVLVNFPDQVIRHLTSLQKVKIDIRASWNLRSPFGKGFLALKNLRHMEAGTCYMNRFITGAVFTNVPRLQYIDISSCRIERPECLFCNLKELKHLDISDNNLPLDQMENVLGGNVMHSLEVLKMADVLENNKYYPYFPTIVFDFLSNTNISKLYINKNNFVRLSGGVNDTLPPTLRLLDFSENKLIQFTIDMPFLIKLNLRNNFLGQFLIKNYLTRSTEAHLRYIDLSLNSISHLSVSIFHAYPHLEVIDLSNNLLSQIDFDLLHLKALRHLILSNNSIGSFNKTVVSIVDNLKRESNLIIDLSHNDLQCDCRTTSFLQWMLDNQGHFQNINNYTCKLDDGTIVPNDFRNYVLQLQKDCASHAVLIVCVSLGITIACIVVMSGLVYRYRWKLRYMYYTTKSKYQRLQPTGSNNVYKYNAFIAYSDTETNFIVKELITNLEGEDGIQLCVHQRDFIPGEEINVNITNAIQESKKIVCIITKSFLESYYCMFEFNMARMESIYSRDGENIFLLVFYEQIVSRDLPLVMLELVEQQSYIEYPHNEQGDVLFWEKLKDAIR